MIPSYLSSDSSQQIGFDPNDTNESDMDDAFIAQWVLEALEASNHNSFEHSVSLQASEELGEADTSTTRKSLKNATTLIAPKPVSHLDTSFASGSSSAREDFNQDPDLISSEGTYIDISNRFRSKILEIVEKAGGLRNKKAVEKAIEETKYKRGTFEVMFRNRQTLAPLTKSLYRFSKDCSIEEYASNMNQRIQNLKKSCLEQNDTPSSLSDLRHRHKKSRTAPQEVPYNERRKEEEIPTNLL